MTISTKALKALIGAAMALETIDEQAGADPDMKTIVKVRAYARSRAAAAREVIRTCKSQ